MKRKPSDTPVVREALVHHFKNSRFVEQQHDRLYPEERSAVAETMAKIKVLQAGEDIVVESWRVADALYDAGVIDRVNANVLPAPAYTVHADGSYTPSNGPITAYQGKEERWITNVNTR
jgi:hypothetical protein